MKRSTAAMTLIGCCMLASACGSKADPAKGEGVALPDVSKVAAAKVPDGRKVDAGVMRNRSVAGRWVGRIGEDKVDVTLGAAKTMSLQITRNGSLTDMASGRYDWTPDGKLSGTTTGGGSALSPYATWNGAFTGDVLNVSGAGTTLALTRQKAEPMRNPVRPGTAK